MKLGLVWLAWLPPVTMTFPHSLVASALFHIPLVLATWAVECPQIGPVLSPLWMTHPPCCPHLE